ncbi:integrase core domain-containing protein [Ligilactobacillus sp. WILCCON 0076]|uniref:Integrase core domain-containing protein n=1 Tax=Ligilactobacillus ubinensis TaxID=2876789 RepID=A0A9X2FMZ9_9LACO|nr:integrase core domain-containing protein [Ligilactobacillus ubinensis]
MKHSYSRKGCPYDNGTIESFHTFLKKEEIYLHTYKNFESAKITLFQYIEAFHNNHRIHSSLNCLAPNMFEQRQFTA